MKEVKIHCVSTDKALLISEAENPQKDSKSLEKEVIFREQALSNYPRHEVYQESPN